MNKSEGPRIYNLFPPLVGSIAQWEANLSRIANLRFNWVFLNPFHYPGFSGSLYAVKDYFRLNPKFISDGDQDPTGSLKRFVSHAGELGLELMMDLVINHTAKDSVLVAQHPEWFLRDADGSIKSPSAIDPADSRKITVWGDLAEIDHLQDRDMQWNFWRTLLDYYAGMGFRGFRCDAAYKVPAKLWSFLIRETREKYPGVKFFAETLGCRLEEINAVSNTGFDYLFNSSKWWDFQADWCLEQYERNRHIAPSISFPETHDTERLAEEANGRTEILKQRYLFSAAFSAGVMAPVGFEYGFRKRLNVVTTNPSDWEDTGINLSEFIAKTNLMKANCPVLNSEGPIRRLSEADADHLALLKISEIDSAMVVLLINKNTSGTCPLKLHTILRDAGISPEHVKDISPERALPAIFSCSEYDMGPAEVKVLYVPA